jgi:hypothetical protein
MPKALAALAKILDWGQKKYSPVHERGWLQYDANDTLDSLLRHLQEIKNGNMVDEETGLPHSYSVLFNAAMFIEITDDGDSRPETDRVPYWLRKIAQTN